MFSQFAMFKISYRKSRKSGNNLVVGSRGSLGRGSAVSVAFNLRVTRGNRRRPAEGSRGGSSPGVQRRSLCGFKNAMRPYQDAADFLIVYARLILPKPLEARRVEAWSWVLV